MVPAPLAIETKYSTTTQRVRAFVEGASVSLPWDPGHGVYENHKRAAEKLRTKLVKEGRSIFVTGTLIGAGLPGQSKGFAFLIVRD